MKHTIKPFSTFAGALAAIVCLISGTSAPAGVISVNLANQGGPAYIVGTGTNYGIASQGTYVSGWLNLNNTANAQNLPFSDGTASSIGMFGVTVGGNFNSYNGAYAYTPLYAGYTAYAGGANYNAITLTNLAANFPNGYKVIVYVCGYLSATADLITDGTTTNYWHPYTTAPTAPVTPTQITNTTPGSYQLGQYVVYGDPALLTADTLTLTVQALTGGGVGICGIQIAGVSANDVLQRKWVGNLNNNWDDSSLNWANDTFGTTNYADGTYVYFTDAAVAANPTVNLASAWQPGRVIVSSTKNYTFTGSGIAGATGLTKQDTGTLTLGNPNTYQGNTTISGGNLKLGASNVIPDGAGAGDVSVAAGATFDLNGNNEGINGLSGSGTVDDTGAAATLTVGLDNDTITFPGTLQGALGLTKLGTNSLTLTGTAYHTGATTVGEGGLVLNPSTFSASGDLVVSNGANLTLSFTNGVGLYASSTISFNGGAGLTVDYGDASATAYGVPITTAGALNLNGVTQIGIRGVNFGVGTFTIVSYGAKTGTGSISSTPAFLPSGMVATIQDTGSAINLVVTTPSVQSLLWTQGDGEWSTNGYFNWNFGTAEYKEYPGGFGDLVNFDNSNFGTVTLPHDVHPFAVTVAGNYVLTGSGRITGATGITRAGFSGTTFVLDTTNTYTGLTTVSNGTLQINRPGALGSAAAGTLVVSGASLALSNGITLADEPLTLNGNGTASNNGALRTVDTNNPITLACPITLGSTARIRPADFGQLILTSPITDNGSNYVLFLHADQTNTLVVVDTASNTVGQVTLYGNTPWRGRIRFDVANAFPFSLVNIGGGLFDLNGKDQTFAGLGNGFGPQFGVITNSSASPVTLDVNYSGTNAPQLLSVISGNVNVVKDGTGLQSFGGGGGIVHTYSGTTTVNGGVLGFASDLSQVTNRFIVNSGGTMRGITTIGGPVTINPGGTFYAGYASNAVGSLTISNDLTLAGNTIVALNKDASPSNDVINVTGALSYGGTLTVYNLGTNALAVGDTFRIFPSGGTGNFASIVSDPGVTFNFTDGVLTVASVSSVTSPTLDAANLGGGVLQFSWTGAFKLQYQTNSAAVGLGTNWMDYPDTSNPVNVTNSPAIPATFFRLSSQ
ncbi:MAG TPA: autotransporter-associated beta strand repeat-containing protein [Verrucomicrobiae bacterium]|nr:autotransporter-associated beta strand repeat-containing protein [Verrucomicrobiae bacterium]